jgi:hypothetical protein
MTTRDHDTDPAPTTTAPGPAAGGLIDPNYPAWHPRNDPNDVASRIARRDMAIAASRAEVVADREARAVEQEKLVAARRAEGVLPDRGAFETAIAEAREAGDYARASNLQLEYERKMRAALVDPPEVTLAGQQPVGGLSEEARALLDGTEPIDERIASAREKGFWTVASRLQMTKERQEASR